MRNEKKAEKKHPIDWFAEWLGVELEEQDDPENEEVRYYFGCVSAYSKHDLFAQVEQAVKQAKEIVKKD